MSGIIRTLFLISFICSLLYLGSFSINQWRAERAYPIEKRFININKPIERVNDKHLKNIQYALNLSTNIQKYHLLLGKYYASCAIKKNQKNNKKHFLQKAEYEYKRAIFISYVNHL